MPDPTSASITNQETALRFLVLECGAHVFPVNPDKSPRDGLGWRHLRVSLDALLRHIDDGGSVGIVPWSITGPAGWRYTVLDVDDGHPAIISAMHAPVVMLRSSRSEPPYRFHLYYRDTEERHNRSWRYQRCGGQIRGGFGYVVAPYIMDLARAIAERGGSGTLFPDSALRSSALEALGGPRSTGSSRTKKGAGRKEGHSGKAAVKSSRIAEETRESGGARPRNSLVNEVLFEEVGREARQRIAAYRRAHGGADPEKSAWAHEVLELAEEVNGGLDEAEPADVVVEMAVRVADWCLVVYQGKGGYASQDREVQRRRAAKRWWGDGREVTLNFLDARDDAIRVDRDRGGTLGELAKKYGVHKSRISQICADRQSVPSSKYCTNVRV